MIRSGARVALVGLCMAGTDLLYAPSNLVEHAQSLDGFEERTVVGATSGSCPVPG